MSDILLDYLNNNVHLSKKIQNIETEFKNGVYFCELIEKVFNLKSLNYIVNPKSYYEILQNFDIIKNNLRTIGFYLNDSIIKEVMEGKNGAAAKVIYKIKIESSRKKINFNNILEKLNKNYLNENNKYNNNKNYFINKKQNNELESFSLTSRFNFENSFQKEKNKSYNKNKRINFNELNNLDKLKSSIIDNKNSKRKNDKLKFPKLKLNEKNSDFNNTFQNFTNKSFEDNNLLKINEEEKYKDKDNINNSLYYLNTNYTNKSMKKTHSLFEYNDILNKMNFDAINSRTKSNTNNYKKINHDNFIKYSFFQKNSLKLGINIDDIIPNIKKNAIISKNDMLISPSQLTNNLKSFLKKEESKMKLKSVVSPSNNYSFLNEHKHLIEKSIIKTTNPEEKLFQSRYNKNSSIYKMFEYTRKIDEKNINIERLLKNKKQFSSESFQTNIFPEEKKQFDINEYLDNITITKKINRIEIDSKNKEENYNNMKNIVHLVIDLVEVYQKKQLKLNQELIDIPEYREWNDYFIEGKSFLNLIKKNRNLNNSSYVEKTSKSNIKNIKKEKKEKKEIIMKNENIIKDEMINMEYLDYLNYTGNWNIDKFINKELYGKQLNIVNLLENNIFKFINISNDYIQQVKQSILSKKNINNKELELTEEELNNISIPEEKIINNIFGEIIFLNYDNITSEYSNNKVNLKINDSFENNKTENPNNIFNNEDFSYIPIKICFIGHSFSGRKTQAKLLCEKYKNLKSYSINDITQFYIDEYKRFHLQKEENNKNVKSSKKNVDENKLIEDEKKYKFAFDLIESVPNFDKNKIEELTQEKISDKIKINLLINQIKIDFPKGNESELKELANERAQKRQNLEEELKKLKEIQDNNATSINNTINKKESKKNINNNNTKTLNIQNINEELEKLRIESLIGFILYDFPNTYNQMLQLENAFTGFVQPIDKDIDIRDFQMNSLTNSVDKPYINISNSNPDISSFFNNNNLINQKSFFNSYFLIDLSEEETLKRMNNRFKDPNTGIIYHSEYNPPNPNDKKLNERLIELKEPSEENIKELILQFYNEYPKILYILNIFKNYYKIEESEKIKVFEKIENNIIIELKKYEEGENNDIIGNLVDDINEGKNEIIRYLKRLKEIKRVLPKEFSEEIIKNWAEIQDKYKFNVKNYIKNYFEIKQNIIEQMNEYQEEFIEFLNKSSKKYKLVDIFYKKYNLILEKFPYLQNNNLVKEELEKNLIELSGNLWKLIQDRKLDSIIELRKIKNQNFIEHNLEIFGNIIINLIILETKHYYDKINIIRRFYYEFERPRLSENFPYEYNFKDDSILEEINNYEIFVPLDNKITEKEKSLNENERIISPKIDKTYLNCFKLFFYYDNEIVTLKNKLKEEYNNNMEQNRRTKKKLKTNKKKTLRDTQNIEITKIINEEEELKNALINEKSKYKIRILFLKNFAEKKLEEIYNIGQKTFKDLDKFIIDSVNSQNNALNELMIKIKRIVNEGYFKLKIKDVELDIFDIYEKSNINFAQFNIEFLHLIPKEDKKIDYKELYNIYLDIKNYQIQDNYLYLNTFFEIVFKKYLFEKKSPAFIKYMQQLPCCFIFNFLNKFIIKKSKRYSIIKIKEIFTLLGLLNQIPPKIEQLNNILKNVNDKLKYNTYLTKNDFMDNKLWFENKKEIKNINKSLKNSSISDANFINKIKEGIIKDKKIKIRGSRAFPKIKFNMLNNSKEIIKEIPEEEQLKEYLFNINKNSDELIDFLDFIKTISIKKNNEKKKTKIHFGNLSDIKINLDRDETLSINSLVESIDKTQANEPDKNSKIIGINNSNDDMTKIIKKEKSKILKNKIIEGSNSTLADIPEEKIKITFPECTYFDYLIKI